MLYRNADPAIAAQGSARFQNIAVKREFIPMDIPDKQMIRRDFLRCATPAAALAIGVTDWSAGTAAVPGATERPENSTLREPASHRPLPIRIGILLGTFGRGSLENRLDAVKACGLDCVQLSFDCAGFPDMPEAIPPEIARRICQQATDRGITIASVQGTFNMSHPDADQRGGPAAAPRPGRGLCAARHFENPYLHRNT